MKRFTEMMVLRGSVAWVAWALRPTTIWPSGR